MGSNTGAQYPLFVDNDDVTHVDTKDMTGIFEDMPRLRRPNQMVCS